MRKHFYAHMICDNPGIYDYKYIIDKSDFKDFLRSILRILEQQYEQIKNNEEINIIDITAWEDFLKQTKFNMKMMVGFHKKKYGII